MGDLCTENEEEVFEFENKGGAYPMSKGEAVLAAPFEITLKIRELLSENDKVYFVGQMLPSPFLRYISYSAFLLFFSLIISFTLCIILAIGGWKEKGELWIEVGILLLLNIAVAVTLYLFRRYIVYPINRYVVITESQIYFFSVHFDGQTATSLSPLISLLPFSLLLVVKNKNNTNFDSANSIGNYAPIDPFTFSASSQLYNLDNDVFLEVKGIKGLKDYVYLPPPSRDQSIRRLQSLFNTYKLRLSSEPVLFRVAGLLVMLVIGVILGLFGIWGLFGMFHLNPLDENPGFGSNLWFSSISPIFSLFSLFLLALFAMSIPPLLRYRNYIIYF